MSLRSAIRLVVAVGLTAYVLWASDPAGVIGAARGADLRWIAGAVALVFVDRTLMALRWIDLLEALTPGSRPPFFAVLRVFFVSSFVSNFVPSVAADSYRAYALSRYDVHLAESAASVLLDRLLGIVSVAIVAAGALPFASRLGVPSGVVWLLALTMAGCAVSGAIVLSDRAAAAVVALARMLPVPLLHRVTASLTEAVRRYAQYHGVLLRVLVLSIAVQLIRIAQAYCLGVALGLTVPAIAYCAFVPIIVLLIQVPVTINGLGTAQLAFKYLFVPAGAAAPAAFALSVLFLALGVLGTVPGAVLYVADYTARRPAE
ncbi:MAG TPA: lysylphosphatidylglycerol synthase transmembrane domain-containing protein [Vicinamibacterales bacterium]